jgi:hypothetical protein
VEDETSEKVKLDTKEEYCGTKEGSVCLTSRN